MWRQGLHEMPRQYPTMNGHAPQHNMTIPKLTTTSPQAVPAASTPVSHHSRIQHTRKTSMASTGQTSSRKTCEQTNGQMKYIYRTVGPDIRSVPGRGETDGVDRERWEGMDDCTKRRIPVDDKDASRAGPHVRRSTKPWTAPCARRL
jgi:hypothetical protein